MVGADAVGMVTRGADAVGMVMRGADAVDRRARGRRWLRRIGLALVAGLALPVGMHAHVLAAGGEHVVAATAAPTSDLLIVPGARIHADGTPYGMLRDRLDTAASLWRDGRAARILISGRGGGGLAVDEVAAMRRHLLTHGVPAAVLLEDAQGLRTLDTMDRAHAVFGARSAIVVSNGYHVARAVFLGAHRGLDVVGVAATPHFAERTGLRNHGREVLARVGAWLDVFVFGVRGIGCGAG